MSTPSSAFGAEGAKDTPGAPRRAGQKNTPLSASLLSPVDEAEFEEECEEEEEEEAGFVELGDMPEDERCPCLGITWKFMKTKTLPKNHLERSRGMHCLAGNAMRLKASVISNQADWDYGDEAIGGLPNRNKNQEGLYEIDFVLYQRHRDLAGNVASNREERFAFHTVKCSGKGTTYSSGGSNDFICQECFTAWGRFQKRAKEEVNNRSMYLKESRLDQQRYVTPGLLINRLRDQAKKVRNLQRRVNRYKAAMKARRAIDKADATKGVVLEPRLEKEIFNEDHIMMAYEELRKKDQITNKELMDFLTNECIIKSRIARKSGNRRMRHSPICVQYACALRGKMGKKAYNFFRKPWNLPTAATIQKYKSDDVDSPDGVLHDTLARMEDEFDKEQESKEDKDPPMDSFLRKVSLAFDAYTINGKFAVDYNTKEVVGVADDAFEMDVILHQLEDMLAKERPPEMTDDEWARQKEALQKKKKSADSEDDESGITAGTHMLAFVATVWNKDSQIQHCVARYCTKSMTKEYMVNKITDITCALAEYGFVVNCLGCDGASENRGAIKMLMDDLGLSIEDLLPSVLTHLERNATDLNKLPKKMKVAYPHPSVDEQFIFIGGDMPHAVKKVVNAMENSGKRDHARDLIFEGEHISMQVLYEVYQMTPDFKHENSMRKYKNLSPEVFEKTAYSRMNVQKAFALLSNTMIKLISDWGDAYNQVREKDGAPKVRFEAYVKFIRMFDDYKDWINGEETWGCVERGTVKTKRIVNGLLDLAIFMEDWKGKTHDKAKTTKNKQEKALYKAQFIPITTYEDIVWSAISVIGIYAQDMKDGDKMVQRRSGSDCCEHLFCAIRSKRATQDAFSSRNAIAQHDARNTTAFAAATAKGNSSSSFSDKALFDPKKLGVTVAKKKQPARTNQPKKKRGRPAKNSQASTASSAPAPAAPAAAASAVSAAAPAASAVSAAAPAPPLADANDAVSPALEEPIAQPKKKRGRPEQDDSGTAPNKKHAGGRPKKKKRGRRPKKNNS